jgi:hypothetical protein
MKVTRVSPVVLGLLGALGCSDQSTAGDAAPITPDRTKVADQPTGLPDGFVAWSCLTPNKSCNAHNACAIDPICGADKLCWPSSWKDCDDGLACTVDECGGDGGGCTNTPKEGTCVIWTLKTNSTDAGAKKADSGARDGGAAGDGHFTAEAGTLWAELRCFQKGDRNPSDPCQVCTPEAKNEGGSKGSSTTWSLGSGGTCDDGDDCTKDDTCTKGSCKGTTYLCSDGVDCTTDLCDGKGGCLGSKLQSSSCLVNNTCYKDGEADSTGCNKCDVSKSQSSLTAIGNHCTINGTCYAEGDKHTMGCAVCTTATSSTSWTVPSSTNRCLIEDVCYNSGDLDSTGCSSCDPSTSKYAWTTLTGVCKINGACYKSGDKHPMGCAECDPATSSTSWTVPSSTNQCLIEDQCKNSGDLDPTGCAKCDPSTSKYAWTTLTGVCKINGACYKSGDKHPMGCAECDPATSSTSWTVPSSTNQCLIEDQCKNSGDSSSTGCGSCDPTKSKYAWTASANKCLVQGSCVADKATDPTGCLTCDATSAPNVWTASSGVNLKSYGFESGASTGWTISNSSSSVGWVVSTRRASNGSYALYYGDPAIGTYDTSGSANHGTATMPTVSLTASKKAGLSFRLYMDTESGTTYDQLKVNVNGTLVWEKDYPTTNVTMSSWMTLSIDLSAYAGSSISIEFSFDTVDSSANTTEGVFIDEIYLWENC